MFPRRAPNASPKIDENRSLPYKPRQLSADGPVSFRAAQLGLEMARFGQATITGRDLIQQANLPRSAENDPWSGLINPANWCASAVTASAPALQPPAAARSWPRAVREAASVWAP